MSDREIVHKLPKARDRAPVSWLAVQPFFTTVHSLSRSWAAFLTAFLAVLAVLSRLYNLGGRALSYDESLHAYYSWLLATGKGYTDNPLMHGPLLFEATALPLKLFGASDFTVRLVPVVLGILLVVLIPRGFRRWLGQTGALVVSTLLLISPFVLYYSRYIRHDLILDVWMVLAILFMFRYLEDRRELDFLILAGLLALMFSTMEITFIYLVILAGFLVLLLIVSYGFSWQDIHSSPAFDLLVLLVSLGAFFSAPIALVVLNPIWTRLTGSPYINVTIFNTQDFNTWGTGFIWLRIAILWGIFIILGTVIGLFWDMRRWLKALAVFLFITITLCTTFFTNLAGIKTGFIGSLGYWLSQQGVARGSQPWYYYLLIFPLYGYLPLIGTLCGGIYFLVHRKRLASSEKRFVAFLIWWGALIFIALTLAGEKMPWLSVHIAIPLIFLTGWWVGHLLVGLPRWASGSRLAFLGRGFGLGVVLVLVALTMRTSIQANYINDNSITEYIDYAHGAPGLQWLNNDLATISRDTRSGSNLNIAYDSQVTWPVIWYLKNFPNLVPFSSPSPDQISAAQVVIASPDNWSQVQAILGNQYMTFQVIRIWWPLEDYKNLTWDRIRYAFTNPQMRTAVWDILWNRDYHLYAQLTNQDLNPPVAWPLQESMRIYIRKDVISQLPGGISQLQLKSAYLP